MSLEDAALLFKLLGEVTKSVKEDKTARLEQFKSAMKKMDEEDIDYFREDLKKVDKIINCKNETLFNILLVVMEASGVLVHMYKEHVSQPIIENLLTHFAQPLTNLK